MIIEERAYARAGLLGNPSDGYYGKTISISVKNFGAHISLYESPELKIWSHQQDLNEFRNIHNLIEQINLHGYYGGDRLIKAAIKKFYEYCLSQNIKLEKKNFTIRYNSSIPRQVGLAGSSAIITATMKALIKFYKIKIATEILPTVILNAEIEELGINAGLQDRVIQVYEGCIYMDFEKKNLDKNGYGLYQKVDTKYLRNLYVAYNAELGKISGTVLNDIHSKYSQGDKFVINTLNDIASLAETGREAIKEKNYDLLNELINKNFDYRKQIMNISDRNIQLVQTARSCGASAKFAGSGGSIIGLYKNDEMLTELINEMKKINARVIKPYVS